MAVVVGRGAAPRLTLTLTLALAACGAEPSEPGADGGAGRGGAGGEGLTGCVAGDRLLVDGSCQPPGVPPERCAEGFEPDGLGGCEAVLPADPCEPGTMAIPGETTCRELAPCGAAPWGDIPTEGEDVQHVDGSYAGSDADGSAERPWPTIQQGINAAAPGGLVAVAAGSYAEPVAIVSHAVRLWGRCPALVEVTGGDVFSVDVGSGEAGSFVAGTELHTIAISGAGIGFIASDALELLLDRVWVHDTGDAGFMLADAWGPASARVTGSLVERATGVAMAVTSAALVVEQSVVRDTVAGAGADGRGIAVELSSASPGLLELRSSVVERNQAVAVAVRGIDLLIDASVIRDTLPDVTGSFGNGLAVGRSETNPSVATSGELRRSVISGNRYAGMVVEGSELRVEDCVVRDTEPEQATNAAGAGVIAQIDKASGVRTTLSFRQSLIAHNYDTGLGIISTDATIESTIVRATQPIPGDGTRGLGVIVSFDADLEGELQPSVASLRWSRVEDNRVVGLSIVGSAVDAQSVRVTATRPLEDGRFGDGIAVLGGPEAASIALQGCYIGDSARAGLSSFGATVSIQGSRFDCNAIDLDGETFFVPFSFEDLGANQCGCDDELAPCQAVSSSLEPPMLTGR